MVFKNIALAITFSPNSKSLLTEAKRLKVLFSSQLTLIHIGEKDSENESAMNKLISDCELDSNNFNMIWRQGDVGEEIIKVCIEEKVDLLITGALIKENVIKYYIGSVARTLMREAPCSVLVLTSPSKNKIPYQKFCVSVEYSSLGEEAVKKGYQFALLEKCNEIFMVREFQLPGFASTISDTGSIKEAEDKRSFWKKDEEQKLNFFIGEMNLFDVKINTTCLFGKQGWEVSNFASENNCDLLIIPSPKRKSNLFDKIFQHDWEFVFKELPCSILIIK